MERSSLCGIVAGERTSTPTGLIFGSFWSGAGYALRQYERPAHRQQRYSAGVALYRCPGHLLRQSIGRGAVDEVGDDGGPAGLMTGADAGAVVAVEVLVKEDVVAPVRVCLHHLGRAEDRATAIGSALEDRNQAARDIIGNLVEGKMLAGAGRILHLKIVAKATMQIAQPSDQDEIRWHPDRTSPVRVAAKHPGARLGRLIADRQDLVPGAQFEGVVEVVPAERSDTVVAEELVRVEHPGQDATQPLLRDQCEDLAAIAIGVHPLG